MIDNSFRSHRLLPVFAVAVLLLNGGGAGPNATGGTVAGPVAKTIIQADLGGSG